MVLRCIDYFTLLRLGQKAVTEDEEAKALVGTVDGRTLVLLIIV